MVAQHYRYYVTLLRQLPFGAFRRFTRRTSRGYPAIEPFIRNKYGLEIGGPSSIFCKYKLIPVYDRCRAIDNCNFSERTIWSDAANCDSFGTRRGREFVADASDLSMIPDETYDFVLASHVFEHLANPLRTLQECKRVLKTGGALVIVVPDKRATFDRNRPFTTFEHLMADMEADTPQDDLTHLNEILALHDLGLDPWAGSSQEFRARCLKNASTRAMHHHVFRPEVLTLMLGYVQMRVLNISIERPFHIVMFGEKITAGDYERARSHNLNFVSESAGWRKQDPLCRLSTASLGTFGFPQSLCSCYRVAF